MTKPKRRPVGETIGGILVGFDAQVFRTTPPAQELVRKGQPVRGVSGEGGTFELVFPDDGPVADDLPPGLSEPSSEPEGYVPTTRRRPPR